MPFGAKASGLQILNMAGLILSMDGYITRLKEILKMFHFLLVDVELWKRWFSRLYRDMLHLIWSYIGWPNERAWKSTGHQIGDPGISMILISKGWISGLKESMLDDFIDEGNTGAKRTSEGEELPAVNIYGPVVWPKWSPTYCAVMNMGTNGSKPKVQFCWVMFLLLLQADKDVEKTEGALVEYIKVTPPLDKVHRTWGGIIIAWYFLMRRISRSQGNSETSGCQK